MTDATKTLSSHARLNLDLAFDCADEYAACASAPARETLTIALSRYYAARRAGAAEPYAGQGDAEADKLAREFGLFGR